MEILHYLLLPCILTIVLEKLQVKTPRGHVILYLYALYKKQIIEWLKLD